MRIRFTRLTNDRHALEILRQDGSRERAELETRSFLLHDLTHYALESTMALRGGVYGTLASGKSLAELNDKTGQALAEQNAGAELLMIERVTGPLHAVIQGRATVEDAYSAIQSLLSAEQLAPPAWLTRDGLARTAECLRKLLGRFRGTPFGQAMELTWPVSESI